MTPLFSDGGRFTSGTTAMESAPRISLNRHITLIRRPRCTQRPFSKTRHTPAPRSPHHHHMHKKKPPAGHSRRSLVSRPLRPPVGSLPLSPDIYNFQLTPFERDGLGARSLCSVMWPLLAPFASPLLAMVDFLERGGGCLYVRSMRAEGWLVFCTWSLHP